MSPVPLVIQIPKELASSRHRSSNKRHSPADSDDDGYFTSNEPLNNEKIHKKSCLERDIIRVDGKHIEMSNITAHHLPDSGFYESTSRDETIHIKQAPENATLHTRAPLSTSKSARSSPESYPQEYLIELEKSHNIATILYRKGRYDEAGPWYEKVLKLQKKILGDEHPYTLETVEKLKKIRRLVALLYRPDGGY